MKRVFLFIFLMTMCIGQLSIVRADQTVTVTATNADISEDLDLKTVATLFGQAKDLEQFEQMLNNPDSAFSNLDLNGDGNVDYLRVIETADQNRHLIVIQAVLAKDIYQDVASIFVEKDANNQVTVQVIGDEYIYGADYIIEPVYIYRPVIYDWFWGPSWVCWHSPFYWDYWPTWWHPYHCIAHHLYWDHIYWHHHYYPICTYRTGHHHHPHYAPMRDRVSRSDYATRHPERSFASRNASRNYTNARSFDRNRQTAVRSASDSRVGTDSRGAATRVSNRSTATASRTFGSSNVRSSADNAATRGTATRNTSVSRGTSSSRSSTVSTTTRSTSNRSSAVATPSRSASTAPRSSATRSTAPSVNRSSSASTMRSSSNAGTRSSSSSAVRSSGSSSMRSSGGSYSSGGSSMRSSGGGSSSRGGGGTRR